MSHRSDVSPSTLGIDVEEDAVAVEYLDGRRTRYRGPIEATDGDVRCRPGMEVHVLVTDPEEEAGVMVYVNDRKTGGDILESSGVGRVVLEPGESAELFPGVRARMDGYAVEVSADPSAARGRVFVFEEDATAERAYEIVEG